MVKTASRRARINKESEKQVLIASRRRCCLCYFLNGIKTEQKGQMAHLNHDPSNSEFSNLVYLCLNHHDDFDSITKQSKGYTVTEVEEYRNRLYKKLGTADITSLIPRPENIAKTPSSETDYHDAIRADKRRMDYLKRPWRILFPKEEIPELFAFKSSNRFDGVCRVERVNLPDGRVVILCEELDDNPGISVTNSIEEIAFQICQQYKIDPQKLVLIEHYETWYLDEDEWNLVTFKKRPPKSFFEDPQWHPMTGADWKQLGFSPRKRRSGVGRYPTSIFVWFDRRSHE